MHKKIAMPSLKSSMLKIAQVLSAWKALLNACKFSIMLSKPIVVAQMWEKIRSDNFYEVRHKDK